MERWLNSRPALVAAWSLFGLLGVAILGAVLYVTIPSVSGGGSDGSAAAAVTVLPPPSGTPAGTRTRVSGTVERVEGTAMMLHPSAGEPVRVVLRRTTAIGRMADGTQDDITEGREAAIRYSSRDGGQRLAFRIWLQPTYVPPPEDTTRAGSATNPAGLAAGTIVSRNGNRLLIRIGNADLPFDIPTSVRVERFDPMQAGDLSAGQRVTVTGERLVDGSLAAEVIQVFGPR